MFRGVFFCFNCPLNELTPPRRDSLCLSFLPQPPVVAEASFHNHWRAGVWPSCRCVTSALAEHAASLLKSGVQTSPLVGLWVLVGEKQQQQRRRLSVMKTKLDTHAGDSSVKSSRWLLTADCVDSLEDCIDCILETSNFKLKP